MASASVSVTSTNRIIALVDMDCFYVQVEERDDPTIKGIPAAVVQYKAYKGGGIIAVNYEARAKGVTRHIRGDDAKAVCPEIKLVRVPESRGKADLTKYRDAGREVINVLTDFSSCVERASIDEAYIDLTEAVENRLAEISSSQYMSATWNEKVVQSLNMEYLDTNFVLGYDSTQDWLDAVKKRELSSLDDLKLAIGAEIVGKMRDAVYRKTSFRCSAGIAHNKVLAKLVCGINKPNKQTILPHESVTNLWCRTKVGKVRGLGGKLGEYVESLGCVFMNDLRRFTEKELGTALGSKTGTWLYQLALGYDDEAVTPRQLPKSIGCNKNFFGPEALKTREKSKFWINQLASEVVERIQRDLETNNRRAKTVTLHVKFENQNPLSRSCGIPQYNAERMATDAFSVLEKLYQSVGVLPINSLGLIASKFEDEIDTSGCSKINEFFKVKPNNSNASINECSIIDSTSQAGDNFKSSKNKNNQNCPLSGSSKAMGAESLTDQGRSEKIEVNAIDSQLSNEISQISQKADENPRKPFFQFLESAPKPVSPRKSPRKAINPLFSHNPDEISNKAYLEATATALKECERCGKKIVEWDYESHMDYHFAKDLSREINGLPALKVDVRAEASSKKSTDTEGALERTAQKRPRGSGRGALSMGSKRGRGAKTTSASTSSKSKTIDSYFLQKSE